MLLPVSASSFILLADPEFSKPTELTAGLDFAFPAANKFGGWKSNTEHVLLGSGCFENLRALAMKHEGCSQVCWWCTSRVPAHASASISCSCAVAVAAAGSSAFRLKWRCVLLSTSLVVGMLQVA
jgi:hypothetical protein